MRIRDLSLPAVVTASLLLAESHFEPPNEVFARTPAKTRALRNPLENDQEAAAAGKKLFEQHCAECHGEMGEGSRRGPALQSEAVSQATPGEIFWVLTNGVVRKGMPAWSKLPEPQRWQIVSYLKWGQGFRPVAGLLPGAIQKHRIERIRRVSRSTVGTPD